jgi:hypothetical protein
VIPFTLEALKRYNALIKTLLYLVPLIIRYIHVKLPALAWFALITIVVITVPATFFHPVNLVKPLKARESRF